MTSLVNSALPYAPLLTSIQDTDLVPPRLDPSDLQPFSSELKVLLDDVDKELTSVIAQHPEEQHRVTKAYMPLASSANEFNIILGSKDCKDLNDHFPTPSNVSKI